MKIIKLTYLREITNKKLPEYKVKYNMQYLGSNDKYKKYSFIVFLSIFIPFILLLLFTEISIENLLPQMDSSSNIFGLIIIAFLIGSIGLMTIFHEVIHYLFYPFGKENKYFVLDIPLYLHVFYNGFVSQKRLLVVLIAPFLIINLTLIALGFVGVVWDVVIILLVINLMGSSGDIFVFFDILLNSPVKSHFYASHFTTDL